MRALLLVVVLLVLIGCGRNVKDLPARGEAELVEAPAAIALLEQPEFTPKCERADKAWLRQRPAPEGSILRVFDVSRARRRTIELLNGQLASIAAALKLGCLEAP